MNEIGKVQTIDGGDYYVIPGGGIDTSYYEITKEEFERITSIENWRAKLRAVCESNLSDAILIGYGFYGCDLIQNGDKYYYTIKIGSSCD